MVLCFCVFFLFCFTAPVPPSFPFYLVRHLSSLFLCCCAPPFLFTLSCVFVCVSVHRGCDLFCLFPSFFFGSERPKKNKQTAQTKNSKTTSAVDKRDTALFLCSTDESISIRFIVFVLFSSGLELLHFCFCFVCLFVCGKAICSFERFQHLQLCDREDDKERSSSLCFSFTKKKQKE